MTTAAFFERPASTSWEALPVHGVDGACCWAWFRPEHLPNDAAVTIPPKLVRHPGAPLPFSLLHVVQALGLPWESLAWISLYGREWQSAAFWSTTAGQFLPAPDIPANSQILLVAQQSMTAVRETQPHGPVSEPIEMSTTPKAAAGRLRRLDMDWKACQGLERQLSGLRQQLSAVLGRLGSLDRDLSPEENLAADSLLKDEWLGARRWIRDASSRRSRCIKAHDIGVTSTAGRRGLIQQMYEQTSDDVLGVGDLTACVHEMEIYRRDLTNLLNSVGTALQGATTNGIQRAHKDSVEDLCTGSTAARKRSRKVIVTSRQTHSSGGHRSDNLRSDASTLR